MDLRDWCAEMEKTYVGRIALSNIIYDCEERRVPLGKITEFFATLVSRWSGTSVRDHPERLIQTVARDGDLYVQASKRIRRKVSCSRVVAALDFFHDNVDLNRNGWTITDVVPQSYLDEVESGLTGLAKNNIPHARPFAWVTKTGALRRLKKGSRSTRASKVCTRMGLLHFFQRADLQLLEVRYPPSFDARNELAPPTFMDGAPYIVYRSRAGDTGWGLTLDLKGVSKGLPEAVHRPVPFNDQFQIESLDRVGDAPAVPEERVLYETSPRPWQSDDIRKLEELLE